MDIMQQMLLENFYNQKLKSEVHKNMFYQSEENFLHFSIMSLEKKVKGKLSTYNTLRICKVESLS